MCEFLRHSCRHVLFDDEKKLTQFDSFYYALVLSNACAEQNMKNDGTYVQTDDPSDKETNRERGTDVTT